MRFSCAATGVNVRRAVVVITQHDVYVLGVGTGRVVGPGRRPAAGHVRRDYLPGASCDGCVLFLCDALCPVVGCTRRAGVPARAVFLWFGARAVLVLPVRRAVCFLCAATGERAPSVIFLVCSCCATCVRDVCAR